MSGSCVTTTAMHSRVWGGVCVLWQARAGDDVGDDEYIRIGTVCSDTFTLTANTNGVSGVSVFASQSPGPFWLSCRLFGVLMQTDQFTDLRTPTFAATRDVFCIRSTVQDMAQYLTGVHELPVLLCAPGVVLGVATVNLGSLLTEDGNPASVDPHFVEAEVTGGFPLRPFGAASRDGALVSGPADAMVHASFQLVRERRRWQPQQGSGRRGRAEEAAPPPPAELHGTSALAAVAASAKDAELVAALRRLQEAGGVLLPLRGDGPGRPLTEAPPSPKTARIRQLEESAEQQRRLLADKDDELLRASRRVAATEAEAAAETARLQQRLRDAEQQLADAEVRARDAAAAARERERALEDANRRVADLEQLSSRTGQSLASREAELTAHAADLRRRLSEVQDALRGKEQEVDAGVRRLRELDLAWQEKVAGDMKRAEAERLAKLEQGHAERERQRVAELLSAQENYQKLEMRLRKALAEAERRDSNLKLLTSEAERTYSAKLAEVEVAKRHAREETEHVVKMERQKNKALAEQLEHTRGELEQRKARERALEDDLVRMKERLIRGPDAELQRTVAALEADKAALVRVGAACGAQCSRPRVRASAAVLVSPSLSLCQCFCCACVHLL
jgi:hypothetical protein